MFNKVLGYILLAAGLVIIAATVWQSFFIFTGKTSAPLLFQTPANSSFPAGSTDVQKQISQSVQEQLNRIIPPASITRVLNLSAWLMLAFVLVSAGGALAGIGVKLINGK